MRLGIIADTHDRKKAIKRAVQVFKDNDVSVVIHCGDINKPCMVEYFADFEFHAVLGNNDQPYREELDEVIDQISPESKLHGTFAELEFDGTKIAVTHGVVEDRTYGYAESGKYDFVLHGHFHETEKTPVDDTVVINPGAHRSVVILETTTHEIDFVPLEEIDTQTDD